MQLVFEKPFIELVNGDEYRKLNKFELAIQHYLNVLTTIKNLLNENIGISEDYLNRVINQCGVKLKTYNNYVYLI